MKAKVDTLATQAVRTEEILDDIMDDPSLTPMFFVHEGLIIPLLDEEDKDNSWPKTLKNKH